MIANSGHDENGKYSGGKAGDQTGTEWQIQPWYNRPWTNVLRYPVVTGREKIAELAEEAAKNNLIGYDQNQRGTFWKQLKASGYHPMNITVACEADCSAGVAAIVKAVGYLLGDKGLQEVPSDMYTGNEITYLTNAGFLNLTDKKVLESDKYLMRGDILLCKGHHTAINLTTGPGIAVDGWHWVKDKGIWYWQDQYGRNAHGWLVVNHHWYYFADDGAMQTGPIWINDELFYLMETGDLEGACCKTDERGALHPWRV